MGFGQAQGFIAALVVAVLGSLVVRLVLNAIARDKYGTGRRRRRTDRRPDVGYHRPMTEASTTAPTAAPAPPDERPYSPGLGGVIAGETALSLVDGERGRLLYRGYRIGDLVEHGTYQRRREPAVDRRVGSRRRGSPRPRSRPRS